MSLKLGVPSNTLVESLLIAVRGREIHVFAIDAPKYSLKCDDRFRFA